jgi:hypothetical protein
MLRGRKKDGPDDQLVFCSGLAFYSVSNHPSNRRSLVRPSSGTKRRFIG